MCSVSTRFMHQEPDLIDCAFCRRVSVGHFLFEDEMIAVFRDAHPLSRGHLHITPRRHAADFFKIPPRSHGSLDQGLLEGWQWLEDNLHPDGYNIGVNIGRAAGQSVPHGNIHLIPRYKGDLLDSPRGSRWLLGKPKSDPDWSIEEALGIPLLETREVVAFRHPHPLVPGHLLVAPRRDEANFFALRESERDALWSAARAIRDRIDSEAPPDGYNLAIDVGAAAGQNSGRTLLHLLPRWKGDAPEPRGVRWMAGENPDYLHRGIGH